MASRKIDLMIAQIESQNANDAARVLKDAKIFHKIAVAHNQTRDNLLNSHDFHINRVNHGRFLNEIFRLENSKDKTPLSKRGGSVTSKSSTNFSTLNKINKDFNYLTNINNFTSAYFDDQLRTLQAKEDIRLRGTRKLFENTDFYNYDKRKYLDLVYDMYFNSNNDKKLLSDNILFNLNRDIGDELQKKKDIYDAKKYDNYVNGYLKNKKENMLDYHINNLIKQINAKTKYNDYFLDKDDELLKRVRKLKNGEIEDFNDPYKDYARKTIDPHEIQKRRKKEEMMKKLREKKIKGLDDLRNQRYQEILKKENKKFKSANKKENKWLRGQKNAQMKTIFDKADLEKKRNEAELRLERIYKNSTVYKDNQCNLLNNFVGFAKEK